MSLTECKCGRPAGEIRHAVLQAVRGVQGPDDGLSLREVAAAAGVAVVGARWALVNLRRAGLVRVAAYRKVDYRNRPVAVYAPAAPGDDACPVVERDAGAFLTGCWR